MPRSICGIDKFIDLSEQDSFVESYIQVQSDAAYEEIGDVIDENPQEVISLAGDMSNITGEDYFINKARAINHCLMQRYLGICAAGNCTTRKSMTELIETAVSVKKLAL